MRYLLIENRGTTGTDLLTIVGASTARNKDEMIGQFGSGAKYALALLLRKSLEVKLCIGKDTYEFGIDERETRDVADREFKIREVVMRQVGGSNRKTRPMGFDVSFGEIDWKDAGMAAREFVSNSADASMTLSGGYDAMRIELVDEPTRWARDGYTRVYIQADAEIRRFYDELSTNFLIFNKGFDIDKTIIPKADRSPVRIYRKGVKVGSFNLPSLFDYNLNDIPLKESRVISEGDARTACSKAIKKAGPEILTAYLEAIVAGEDVYEINELDAYSVQHYSWDSDEHLASWSDAIDRVFGSEVVICDSDRFVESVHRKGYRPIRVKSDIGQMLKSYKARMAADVLDHFEATGRQLVELTPTQRSLAARVWRALVEMGVTDDKPAPALEGYCDIMKSGGNVLGYYDPKRKVVGLSTDTLDSHFTLIKVLIEEYAHYVSGAKDETRDMQDYVLRIAANLMKRSLS